jgi:capsid assembly protease
MNIFTINTLLSQVWCMPQDRIVQLNFLAKLALDAKRPQLLTAFSRGVLTIPIRGVLVREGFISPGYNQIASAIFRAQQDPAVRSVVLDIDSPGGTFTGVLQVGEAIRKLKKPIKAIIDGECLGGAYWLASYCDAIHALDPTCIIGGIGVSLNFADDKPAMEKKGVVFHFINSSLSPDKNKTHIDAFQGDYTEIKEQMLNPRAKMLIDGIIRNRPTTNTNRAIWSTGKEFYPLDAIKSGLIDKIINI